MSMIYECPTCHAPQAAGRTACHECGAEFDGAVPEDATLPETAPVLEAVAADAGLPPVQAYDQGYEMPPPMPAPPPPQLQEVNPPPAPAEIPVYQPAPFQPPPPYSPPIYPLSQSAPSLSGFRIPKAALIAIPVVLALILGVVFFVSSMNQEPSVSPPSPASSPSIKVSAPVTPGAPITLTGGQSFSRPGIAGSSTVSKWLVGRWQARTTDYYVLNEDGTGLGGSLTGKQTPETFSWVLVQNQLLLNSNKQEKLVVSKGAGGNSIFVRGDNGRYVEYAKVKSSS